MAKITFFYANTLAACVCILCRHRQSVGVRNVTFVSSYSHVYVIYMITATINGQDNIFLR